jgi:hypothetical protein
MVDEGSLRFHIVALRKALEEDSPERSIVTVPGKGYGFVGAISEETMAHRRDRGTPELLVPRGKSAVQTFQRRVHQPPHRPKRVVGGNARLGVHVRKQRSARPTPAAHAARLAIRPQRRESRPTFNFQRNRETYSAAC